MSPALTQEPDPARVQEIRQPHLEVGEDLALAGQVRAASPQLPGVQAVGQGGLVQPDEGVGVIPKYACTCVLILCFETLELLK